ncbi:DUF2793 domain-containing protein [Rhizobium sp. SSA_523]|uniref:DUF2793 domain-containing protein n=1 Tax=Rhizobium sp. SSA_523 TaxID=2952477 RepID=UPI00208FFEEC|nr:DUF2793 domain-containing protein [Rhizobium sp. SSA_523]MCO5732071.1 DUF2793 domain-containing protein [Rhizobium sp. SSA_523]WKC22592.1 DUF2793 domain-containing protein [Rhizobium sp. SSA_523]
MTDATANLHLPFILPSQAQKHVTHNEALVMLDRLIQMVLEYEGAVAPADPLAGQRFAVSGAASGAWSGRAGSIACFEDGAWHFLMPTVGFLAWFKDASAVKVFTGKGWERPALPDVLTPSRLGIGTAADATNRLAIAAPATLLTHDGAGHQLKINKAGPRDTASLLFQSNWSGRAEMGLAGDDAFAVKVSGDGGAWATGLQIDGKGRVTTPNRPAARAHRDSGTTMPAAGAETGFSTLSLEQGGVALGAVLAAGGRLLTIPADGLYFLSVMITAGAPAGFSLALLRNSATPLLVLKGAAALQTLSAAGLFPLYSGDSLSFQHGGTARIEEGAGATQLSLARL